MSLLETVEKTLLKFDLEWQYEKILVGVSGGVDSLTLLKILYTLQPRLGYDLHVASFDHGLRGTAGSADVDFVRQVAVEWNLPFSERTAAYTLFDAPTGVNVEGTARKARYSFLLETALEEEAGFIALGHHQDDQVETLLMHLMRGTGLGGLRGMLPLASLSDSHLLNDLDDDLYDMMQEVMLLRPLLEVSRAEITAYAQAENLTPRQDETNSDTTFLRNRLRHEVIPLLESINPNLRPTLARTATIVQGDYAVIENMVSQTAAQLVEWSETLPDELGDTGEIAYIDRRDFLKLSAGLQRQLLRHILLDLIPGDLPFQQIETARNLIKNGVVGQQLTLPSKITLSLGYDEFMIYDVGVPPFPRFIPYLNPTQVIPLDIESESHLNEYLRFYSFWVLDGYSHDLARTDPLEATLNIPPDAELSLRTRRPGDRFAPMGMEGHSQKLADIFTNLKIPKALRDRVPLLTVNDQIAWFVAPTIHGLQGRVADAFAVRPDSSSVLRVRWEVQTERLKVPM